jgi:hypothetical protein
MPAYGQPKRTLMKASDPFPGRWRCIHRHPLIGVSDDLVNYPTLTLYGPRIVLQLGKRWLSSKNLGSCGTCT